MSRLFYIHQKQTASFLAPLLGAFLSLVWAVASSHVQSGSDVFTISDFLGLRTVPLFGNPVVSPDGKFIVYQISYLGPESRNEGKHQEMWLLDTETRKATLISDDSISCSEVTWSPDRQRVAFYDGERSGIRVWSLASQKSKIIATDVQRNLVLSWSRDGRHIFARRVSSGAAAKTDDPAKQGIVEYRSRAKADESPFRVSDDSESILVAIDVETGVENIIARRRKMNYFAVSPNG